MIESRRRAPAPYLSLYSPGVLAPTTLERLFVARLDLVARMLDDIRGTSSGVPQHLLVLGKRGMGKTALLRRLQHAVHSDLELARTSYPLVLPEEQYNVADLSGLWLNCVDALSDRLETDGRHDLVARLEAEVVTLRAIPDEPTRRRGVVALLVATAEQLDRRLILLIDRLDLVLDRLADDDGALGEVFSGEPRLLIVATSGRDLQTSCQLDDRLRVHTLGPLDDEATFAVLRRLAEVNGQPHVLELLERDPARIRALETLGGGTPRSSTLLFDVLAMRGSADVRADLQGLLDRCTPAYRARITALAPQAQRIVHTLALAWHPRPARDVATALHLSVNQASSQLDRLVRAGVVEKVALPDTRRHGFQLAERLFNIWYLMRQSRRGRRQLLWLVEFLRLCFGADTGRRRPPLLRHMGARGHDPRRGAGWGLGLTRVAHTAHLRGRLEFAELRSVATVHGTRAALAGLLRRDGEGAALQDRAERLRAVAEATLNVLAASAEAHGAARQRLWTLLVGSLSLSTPEKVRVAEALPDLRSERIDSLVARLEAEKAAWLELMGPEDAALLMAAIRESYLDPRTSTLSDYEAAAQAFDAPPLAALGCAWLRAQGRPVDPAGFDRAVRHSSNPWVWGHWLLGRERDNDASDWQLVSGWRGDSSAGSEALQILAEGLAAGLGRVDEAEDAYEEAISRDDSLAAPWNGLGDLLTRLPGRHDDAEEAYRQAISRDDTVAAPWNGLGNLLSADTERHGEAEDVYKQAVLRDSSQAAPWHGLGTLLSQQPGRHDEAERAFESAISRDDSLATPWNGLGNLLARRPGRSLDAENAYTQAIARDNTLPDPVLNAIPVDIEPGHQSIGPRRQPADLHRLPERHLEPNGLRTQRRGREVQDDHPRGLARCLHHGLQHVVAHRPDVGVATGFTIRADVHRPDLAERIWHHVRRAVDRIEHIDRVLRGNSNIGRRAAGVGAADQAEHRSQGQDASAHRFSSSVTAPRASIPTT